MSEETVNDILSVGLVSKDGGDYVARCPHCKRVIGIEGDDISEVRGEQYRCSCAGWFEVSQTARFVKESPPVKAAAKPFEG